MGLEIFKLPEAIDPSENYAAELEKEEQAVMEKVKAMFRKNAEASGLLLSGEDLDLSDHQKRYLTGQLAGFRRDTKGVIENLRKAVPLEVVDGMKEAA
ncbi:MAG: hypothetical protein NT170_04640 [Candidatus Moranbacteria bacterium]|nr:hypothetical protein [Candidatus Moranbacteria bacterium]